MGILIPINIVFLGAAKLGEIVKEVAEQKGWRVIVTESLDEARAMLLDPAQNYLALIKGPGFAYTGIKDRRKRLPIFNLDSPMKVAHVMRNVATQFNL